MPTSENKACLCFYNECSRYSTKLKVLVIDRHALLPPITIRTPATTDFYPVRLTNAVIVGDSLQAVLFVCFLCLNLPTIENSQSGRLTANKLTIARKRAIHHPPYQVNSYVCSQWQEGYPPVRVAFPDAGASLCCLPCLGSTSC